MKTDELQTWRAEIAAELEIASTDLAATVEAIAAAQTARDLAWAERHRVAATLHGLADDPAWNGRVLSQPRPAMPSALAKRLDPSERASRQADGKLSLEKQNAENAQRVVDDLKDALERLDRALVPAGLEGAPE
jgi:hypothetical protein